MLENQRGKRRLAHLMFAFLACLFVGGLWIYEAGQFATFLTPWIFGTGLALFGLDGKFANDRELLRYSSESANRRRPERSCEHTVGQDECPECGKHKDK